MTRGAALPEVNGATDAAEAAAPGSDGAPRGWAEIRRDDAIQFEPFDPESLVQPEPGMFARFLDSVLRWLAELFAPLGEAFGASWPVLKWVLVALAVTFAIFAVWRLVGPLLDASGAFRDQHGAGEDEWQPEEAQSLALLSDADALAAKGRYDEAVRLLLRRSVSQIGAARPDWVEPSSTARELAALPALGTAARSAFAAISEMVEKSAFALRALERDDWEKARAAYARFALARIVARDETDARPRSERHAA